MHSMSILTPCCSAGVKSRTQLRSRIASNLFFGSVVQFVKFYCSGFLCLSLINSTDAAFTGDQNIRWHWKTPEQLKRKRSLTAQAPQSIIGYCFVREINHRSSMPWPAAGLPADQPDQPCAVQRPGDPETPNHS